MTAPELGYTFAAPGWFWLLPAVVAALLLRRRRAAVLPLAGASVAVELPRTWRQHLVWLPGGLEAAALLALLVALARPIERAAAPPSPPGRDLIVVLDTSSSMAATDLAAERTRLDVSKQLASEFVLGRRHDRIGLVTFARFADLRCPLTADREALAEILGGTTMVEKDGPEDATAIGAAIGAAALALRSATGRERAIVLVTDGEENVASVLAPDEIAPAHAAQLCREAGVRVHSVVVGRGNQKADGRFVPLDPSAVRQLAQVTGGRLFTAADGNALAGVWAAIDAVETSVFAPPGVVVRECFAPWVWLALVLAALARVLAATAWRRLP